jgi:hypothetical protein
MSPDLKNFVKENYQLKKREETNADKRFRRTIFIEAVGK